MITISQMMTKINHFVAPLKGSLNDNIECSNQQKKFHSIKPNLTRKRIGLLNRCRPMKND
jgi:hypothetical protein